jgi:hypothetical protein
LKNQLAGMLVGVCVLLSIPASATTIFFDNFNTENGGNYALNYTGFTKWTVANGTVDLIGAGSAWDFYPGNGLYVDLDGSTYQAGTMMSINVPVSAGSYVLSFDLGGSQRAGLGSPPSYNDTVEVKVDVGFASQNYVVSPAAPLTTKTLAFTVNSPTILNLVFHNQGGDNVGAILDNVRVDMVPDGALTAMLLGMGLLGIGYVRRMVK